MDLAKDLPSHGSERQKNHSDLDSSHLEHEVYMSLVWQRGQLGLAFYDVNSLDIHLLSDVVETDEFTLIKQAVHQIHPLVIVLNSSHDSRLLPCLKEIVSDVNVMYSPSSVKPSRLEFLPNVNFSTDHGWEFIANKELKAKNHVYDYEVSKRRILILKLPSMPRHFSDGERQLYFQSLIPWKSTNMVRAVGGLLKFLEEKRVGIELETDADQVPILGFKTFTLESQIRMDCLTYSALSIFGVEHHPSVFKSGGHSSKESLSLFGILNRCKSSIGTHRLRDWFLKPLKDAGKIKQRYAAISFLMTPENTEAVSCLEGCLKHIKFLPKVLLRMSKAQASIGDWISVYKTLYHAVYIRNICKTLPKNVDIFVKITNSFTDDLQHCMNLIKNTIDFEESKQRKKFTVQPNVDSELDEKKRFFNGLPDLMTHVAREEIESLNSEIQHCVVSCLPEIGYLLVLNMPEGKTSQDDHSIEGLEFKFASSNQLFYKSPKTKELDNLIGDTQSEILEMEFLIMHSLQSTILECTDVIMEVMNLTADLDCFLALARCASEFGYVRPKLIEEKTIEIKQGRHPLQELCCNPFVPNNTNMGGQSHKMKLLTGPSACGKSVYLKQIALIIFMAHIGSFVPAEEACIGPIDAIFSRIKSTESVSVQMSTFMQDLCQVSDALRSATACSLVILDEFGKGSKSEDGLSLLTAVMKYWIAKGPARPFTLVSTHFHSIIQQKLLPQDEVENLTFDTLCNKDELVFLFQLVPGHTNSSFACSMAAEMGIPSNTVQRGHKVSELLCLYKEVPMEEDTFSKKQRNMHEKIVASFSSLDLKTGHAKKYLTSHVLSLSSDQSQHRPPKQIHTSGSTPRIPQLSEKSVHSIDSTNDRVIDKDSSGQNEIYKETSRPSEIDKETSRQTEFDNEANRSSEIDKEANRSSEIDKEANRSSEIDKEANQQNEIDKEINSQQKFHDYPFGTNHPSCSYKSVSSFSLDDTSSLKKLSCFPDAKKRGRISDGHNARMKRSQLERMANISNAKCMQENLAEEALYPSAKKQNMQILTEDDRSLYNSPHSGGKKYSGSGTSKESVQSTWHVNFMKPKYNNGIVDHRGDNENTSSTSFGYAKDQTTSNSKSTPNSTSSLKSPLFQDITLQKPENVESPSSRFSGHAFSKRLGKFQFHNTFTHKDSHNHRHYIETDESSEMEQINHRNSMFVQISVPPKQDSPEYESCFSSPPFSYSSQASQRKDSSCGFLKSSYTSTQNSSVEQITNADISQSVS